MQILLYFFGIVLELYWNCIGVILLFRGMVGSAPGLARVGWIVGWKRSSQEPSLAGWIFALEFLALALGLACVMEEVKAKSPAKEGWFAAGVFLLGSWVGLCDGRGQAKKPSPCGSDYPNLPKLLKFLMRLMILGVQNDSRNTSREQLYNQTPKKYVILYSNVNVS